MVNDIIKLIALILISGVSFILGFAYSSYRSAKKISRLIDKVTYERQAANKKEIIISLRSRND